jgi:hypothetical protein
VQRIDGESLKALGVNCSMTIDEGGEPTGLVALARTPSRPAALAGTPRAGSNGATH